MALLVVGSNLQVQLLHNNTDDNSNWLPRSEVATKKLLDKKSRVFSNAQAKHSQQPQVEGIVDCRSIQPDSPGQLVPTSTEPSFSMQIHDPTQNRYISKDITEHGCFECDILSAAMHALKSHPDAVLVDVGANIGLYSLSAAAAGHDAYAFEPARINYQRICQSLQANPGMDERITLFARAVTTQPTMLRFDKKAASGNFGGLQYVRGQEQGVEGVDYVVGFPLNTLAGGNVLPVDKPVVLKVDVEGNECSALAGALDYLRQLDDIIYVAIEWSQRRLRKQCQQRSEIFELFAAHHLKPHQRINGQWVERDPNDWENWLQTGHLPMVGLFDIAWSRTVPI